VLLGLLGAVCATQAFAQDKFPSKPIRMVVGYAPGGANDIIARVIAKELQQSLGQPVIVDNRAGAGGLIGSDIVAKAPPDGYTLLLGSAGAQTIAPAITAKMPYDPYKDLAAVSLVADSANVLLVGPAVPFKNVKELIAAAKANPGKYTYSSSGNGGGLHISGALLAKMADIQMVHVPYRGNAPAINDLYGGNVDMGFSSAPVAVASVKTGKARALAVSTKKHIALMPDVPTMEEAGVPGYEVSNWYGVFTTGGTDMKVQQLLAAEIKKAVAKPEVADVLAKQGVEPASNTPAEFTARVQQELVRWDKDLKAMKITAD
jgi:tripartite-type tricarboxylate transporter receptor subunit TctC